MEAKQTTGSCTFCGKICSGSAMGKHLQSCEKRPIGSKKVFLLKASMKPFWVYFEAGASLKLDDIDDFLRSLWLECCGHLSAFTIENTRYSSYHELDYDEKSMDAVLSKTLRPGMAFRHEYDFGTTTELDLKCIATKNSNRPGITVLARNDPPEFACEACEQPAQKVCAQCIFEGKGLFCDSCAESHSCEEEAFLPVVNSPRMGMCGYTGD